ncbi:5765_t:CDS:1, partial [Diversispora eburnea]
DYVTKFTSKQITTKHIGCTWHINLSEPIAENFFNHVYITTFYNTHSYNLNSNIIQFGDNKQIPLEIMKEIEFLTV